MTDSSGDYMPNRLGRAFKAEYAEGYRAGQLAMRERAAKEVKKRWYFGSRDTAAVIRALEPEEPK